MAVRLVSTAFPLVGEGAAWAHCQRYLPHAQVSAALIERWGMQSIEAAQLLHRAGVYLTEQGRYAQAETYLMKSYTIRQHLSGDEHPDVAAQE